MGVVWFRWRAVTYGLPDDGGFFYGSLFSPQLEPGAAGNSLAKLVAVRRRGRGR